MNSTTAQSPLESDASFWIARLLVPVPVRSVNISAHLFVHAPLYVLIMFFPPCHTPPSQSSRLMVFPRIVISAVFMVRSKARQTGGSYRSLS